MSVKVLSAEDTAECNAVSSIRFAAQRGLDGAQILMQ